MKGGFKKKNMILTILLIALFHWIVALLWFLLKSVDVKYDYTGDKKEFIRCQYPLSKNIRYIINRYIINRYNIYKYYK